MITHLEYVDTHSVIKQNMIQQIIKQCKSAWTKVRNCAFKHKSYTEKSLQNTKVTEKQKKRDRKR